MHNSMTEQWGKYYNVLGNHLGCKTVKGNRTKYIYIEESCTFTFDEFEVCLWLMSVYDWCPLWNQEAEFFGFLVYLLSHSDLRPSDTHAKYLREVKSHYNYRLVKPQKNLTCKERCEAVNGFQEYYESYKDDMLGCSIKEAKKGWFK